MGVATMFRRCTAPRIRQGPTMDGNILLLVITFARLVRSGPTACSAASLFADGCTAISESIYNSQCSHIPSGEPVHRMRTLKDLEEIRIALESAGCGGRTENHSPYARLAPQLV
ncbi:hypothetical protein V1509DRAFT_201905 [Lipomyces kononenkoae]